MQTFPLPDSLPPKRSHNILAISAIAAFLSWSAASQAQQTTAQWQARAIAEYPELAVADSPFNHRFLELLQERKAADATFLQDPAWPWTLAQEVARELNPPADTSASAAPATEEQAPPPEAATSPEAVAAAQTEAAPAAGETEETAAEAEAAPATVSEAASATAEWTAPSLPDTFGLEYAKFRWWAPEGVTPRGVLVLLPGRGGDGRGMADNAQWRTLAQELQFGLVGCALKNRKETPFSYQGDPNGGISDLVNRAVNELLAQNGHKIKDPPLAFYGHSAGANVSQNYAGRYPKRVAGAVLMRCPNGSGKLAPGKTEVPLLIVVGKKDKAEWVETSLRHYEEGRGKMALWTLAAHPEEGHGVGKTKELSVAFLKGAVEQRLGEAKAGQGLVKPKKVSRQNGWLGDPESFEIGDSRTFKGKKQKATWFPDEATAVAWQNYLKP